MTTRQKPTLVVDFDGVIHSYEKGWQGGHIYGTVVPGFFEWAVEAKKHFVLAIYSTRSDSHKNIKPMKDWLTIQLQGWHWDRQDTGPLEARETDLLMTDFLFPIAKPPGFVTIDDRAITFKGDWNANELKPENLKQFKTWTEMRK